MCYTPRAQGAGYYLEPEGYVGIVLFQLLFVWIRQSLYNTEREHVK